MFSYNELENTTSVDKNINLIDKRCTVRLLNGDLPLCIALVPYSALNAVLVADVLVAVIFVCNLVHVLVDLL